MFYLYTDGFIDQAGGPKNFPFGRNRLKKLLTDVHKKDFIQQKGLVEKELKDYQGDELQRDDITLIGFKIKS